MPEPDPTNIGKERIILQGEVPSPLNSPSGCKFRTRCKFATEKCAQEVPKMVEIAKGHEVALLLHLQVFTLILVCYLSAMKVWSTMCVITVLSPSL